jgi:hypothetical protein
MRKSMTFEHLKEAIDFLRENGVAVYEGPCPNAHGMDDLNMKLVLLENAPKKLELDQKQSAGPLAKVPRGKDGLTAEEQEELYGRVMDAPNQE